MDAYVRTNIEMEGSCEDGQPGDRMCVKKRVESVKRNGN